MTKIAAGCNVGSALGEVWQTARRAAREGTAPRTAPVRRASGLPGSMKIWGKIERMKPAPHSMRLPFFGRTVLE